MVSVGYKVKDWEAPSSSGKGLTENQNSVFRWFGFFFFFWIVLGLGYMFIL